VTSGGDVLEALAIFAAGFWAGTINVVVGSGTLVTFPVLLLFGYPPLVANVSNNIGLVGGGITGTFGYRSELTGRAATLKRLLPASALGGIAGALLLLVLPAEAFQTIVPILILIGLVMVVWGPAIQRGVARRRETRQSAPIAGQPAVLGGSKAVHADEQAAGDLPQASDIEPHTARAAGPQTARAAAPQTGPNAAPEAGPRAAPGVRAFGHSIGHQIAIIGGVFVLGMYGGYFGAAQGVLLVGLLSVLTSDTLQSITGLKNLLTTVVNALAAITFMIVSWHSVDWKVVLLIAVGATLGGIAGARVGRRLSPLLLRTIIVIVGLAALIRLLFFS
jgi:uncharacterized membrane protein YfcA